MTFKYAIRTSELIISGEGKVILFSDLKLIKRIHGSSSPELVSLISSFKLHPPLLLLDSNSQASVTRPPTTVSEAVQDRLPSVSRVPHATRLDLYGKVLFYSLEHSRRSDSSPVQILYSSTCGAYLHLVTPSHMTPSFSVPSLPTIVTIYLKSSFSTEGLNETLSTSGAEVLLRDVFIENHSNIIYTMDSCSLLVPLATSKRPCLYPLMSSLSEENLSCLHSFVAPPLPLLQSDNAQPHSLVALNGKVVAVDQDNAYSWSVCDLCGNEQLSENVSVLYCDVCDRKVVSPNIHLHMSVFLKCKDCQNAQVHVTLLQSTIKTMLPLSSTNIKNGFDLHRVLGKSLELASCYLQKVIYNADGTVLLRLTEIDIFFETSNCSC